MKKLIMLTMIVVCLVLCAAVWPKSETVRETTQTDARSYNERPGNARCNA